jgi:hypothetical protein
MRGNGWSKWFGAGNATLRDPAMQHTNGAGISPDAGIPIWPGAEESGAQRSGEVSRNISSSDMIC